MAFALDASMSAVSWPLERAASEATFYCHHLGGPGTDETWSLDLCR